MALHHSSDQIVGTAGTGLVDAGWAANRHVAAQGHRGEVQTAEVLNKLVRRSRAVVLHDLNIPIPGFTANVDHVVVSGRKVWLIDSKRWAPAVYWTVGGKTFRGLSRFKVDKKGGGSAFPAESKTMPMAFDQIGAFLQRRGLAHVMARPLIVVWPSSGRPMNLALLRMNGSKAIHGARFARFARRMFGGKAADQAIVAALTTLVNSPTAKPARSGFQRPTPVGFDPNLEEF